MKNLKLINLFNIALDEMPNRFSGHDFSKKCDKLIDMQVYGMTNPFKFDYRIKKDRAYFLKNNCKNISRMTYEKKLPDNTIQYNERDCIEFLKSTGNYKIQYIEKVTTEILHEL